MVAAQRVAKVIHKVVAYVAFVGMVVLLCMMLLTTSDVIGRAFFNRPITGAFEITEYLLVIIVLFGIAYTQQSGRMVRVELFAEKLPPLGQIILDIVFTLMAVGFFALVAWQGYEGGIKAIRVKTASELLFIPTYPFEFLIAVGGGLLTIELLIKLIRSISTLRTGVLEKEITPPEGF